MTDAARQREGEHAELVGLLREVLAELRRKRKAPRVRAAAVARRAVERVATVPITDIDIARARRSMRRRRR